MRIFLAVGLVLTACSTGLLAAESQSEDKIVCKRQPGADLGSHIARRTKVCMRASEWRDLQVMNDEAQRKIMDRRSGVYDPNKITAGAGGPSQ
jgi:hypothetical protein